MRVIGISLSALFLLTFACAFSAFAADALVNEPPESHSEPPAATYSLEPGMTIIMPGGQRGIIEEILPNGDFRTSLGQVVSPDGLILSGPDMGEKIVIEDLKEPEARKEQIKVPAAPVQTPEKAEETQPKRQTEPLKPMIPVTEMPTPAQKDEKKAEDSSKAKQPERRVTIAEMLPSTNMREQKTIAPEKTRPEEQKQAKKPEKEKKAQEPPQKAEPKKAKATEKKHEDKQTSKKPKPGEALRIPPEAAKKGDLAFLEGCWQGTRPEYFSKRTIRECFCFGTNGSGKRRVLDPSGGRMCIGATRAHLAQDGVLSVTSEGASCTDGERWGSAEMVCRNSGPSTPCSWIFMDANNGRQAYTIPFVRVESCGR